MKKLLVVVAVVLFQVQAVRAWWDNAGNPDKTTSFALQVSNGVLNGSGVSTEYLFSSVGNTNVPVEDGTANEVKLFSVSPSMRFPVSPKLTLDTGLTYIHQEYDYSGSLTRFHGSMSGNIFTLGLRYYFDE